MERPGDDRGTRGPPPGGDPRRDDALELATGAGLGLDHLVGTEQEHWPSAGYERSAMKRSRDTIEILTEAGQHLLDVTKRVQEVVHRSGVRDDLLLLSSLHTTTDLFVNEFQSALLGDMASTLQKLAPWRHGYLHDGPRYSTAIAQSACALTGSALGTADRARMGAGQILPGPDQSVVLAELDGPPRAAAPGSDRWGSDWVSGCAHRAGRRR